MLRGLLFRLAGLLLGLVAVVLCLEIGVRLFDSRGASLLRADSLLGQRYRPGVAQTRLIPESGREIALRFNSDGFRGPDRPVSPGAGVRRIAVHGDSQVAAIAVQEEETFVVQLEGHLDSEAAAWEVLNFGVSSYSVGQSLLAWRHVSAPYRPQLVILVFLVSNDVTDSSRLTSSATRPYFELSERGELELLPEPPLRVASSRWLDEHLRVYPWQKDLLRRARVRLRGVTGVVSPGLQSLNSRPDARVEAAWRLTLRVVEQFHREVTEAGADFLLVLAPDAGQFDDEVWQEMANLLSPEELASFDRDYPQRRIAAYVGPREIPCLDLLGTFRRRRQLDGPLSFGRGHWNVAGNRLAAEAVHRFLDSSGYLSDGTWGDTVGGCVTEPLAEPSGESTPAD